MARPSFVDHWTLKWGDLLQVNRKYLGDKGAWEGFTTVLVRAVDCVE